MKNTRNRVEFGDFQTPEPLASQVLVLLASEHIRPNAVVEPTCGLGSFVLASQRVFPAAAVYGFDINDGYVSAVLQKAQTHRGTLHVETQDFFAMDWKAFFQGIDGEILVVGNPPWVTNAAMGVLGGGNLPEKNNFQNHVGFAAKTGKANFDISEWMLIKILESLGARRACLAMLCKTSTARKVLKHAWLHGFPVCNASLHVIDAQAHFGVSVDACLLIVHTGCAEFPPVARTYTDLSFASKSKTIGLHGKELVADLDLFSQFKDMEGTSYYTWRSGVKHDAARVMEFYRDGEVLKNGAGEIVDIENPYLYPLLKSSDLANGVLKPSRYVLLTQRHPGDDTGAIESLAPKTWAYLTSHGDLLDARRSIIYQKRPRFSIFGIGDYVFSPWKVAISGLYKTLRFRVIGTLNGQPIIVDDTCYFVPCRSEHEAQFVSYLLNSDLCQQFLQSLVFPDAKRPVTVDILSRIDLRRLAERLGVESEAKEVLADAAYYENRQSLLVCESSGEYRIAKAKSPISSRRGRRSF